MHILRSFKSGDGKSCAVFVTQRTEQQMVQQFLPQFFVAHSHLKLLLKLAKMNHAAWQLISCGLTVANVSRKKRSREWQRMCFVLPEQTQQSRAPIPAFSPHSDYPLFLPPFRRRQTSRQADAGRTGRPPIWSQLARNATIDEEEGGGRTEADRERGQSERFTFTFPEFDDGRRRRDDGPR